jgi:acyl-CoA thioesterase-2
MTEPESDDREDLLRLLDLQSIGQGAFSGAPSLSSAFRTRVFGGQLLGQALAAASFTVPGDVLAHSLHAYFARPGIPGRPIDYEVTALRDGQASAIRNVAGVQRDDMVFQLTASFGPDHEGPDFQSSMPDTPGPETFPSFEERRAKYMERASPQRRVMLSSSPCDVIPVDLPDLEDTVPKPTRTRSWMRLHKPLPNDPVLHRCVLAYASDMGLLGASVFASGGNFADPELQIASLDHALWFHRPFVWDSWLLFVAESNSVAGGRGFSRGAVYTQDGRLVASLAQEGIIRKRNILPDV